jgi:hypothetical protein
MREAWAEDASLLSIQNRRNRSRYCSVDIIRKVEGGCFQKLLILEPKNNLDPENHAKTSGSTPFFA